MKILVLTNLFPSPWDPHRGSFNRQQFQRLGERHEVDVLTAVDFRERLGAMRGPVRLPHVRRRYFTFWHPPRFGRFLNAVCYAACVLWQRGEQLRAARYDVLLASWAYPDGVAAAWLARCLGVPYVIKVHGSDLNVQARAPLRRTQIAQAMRGARAVVAVSRALAQAAVDLGADPAHVDTLYNGVDTRRFHVRPRCEARTAVDVPLDVPLVLYAGNLKVSKGCADLLQAFALLLPVRPGARLALVGDGPDRQALQRLASRLGIDHAVRFVGAVPHAQLPAWMNAADLLCLPSHNEGVPNVILEAMACGTPVVATRVGGIPEVLPAEAGMMVGAHDPERLAVALDAVLARPAPRAAIAMHAASFRWDDNVDRLESILQRAVDHAAVASRVHA